MSDDPEPVPEMGGPTKPEKSPTETEKTWSELISWKALCSLKPNWEKVGAIAEWAMVVLTVVAGYLAYSEYSDNHKQERHSVAQGAYDRTDVNYNDFLRLCLDHPELDCYSGSAVSIAPSIGAGSSGSNDAQLFMARQRIIYTILIDTFEVAYTNYTDREFGEAAEESYCAQWPGWVADFRKFFRRPAFTSAWDEISNEFDGRFVQCMEDVKREQAGTPPTAYQAAIPPSCRSRWVTCGGI